MTDSTRITAPIRERIDWALEAMFAEIDRVAAEWRETTLLPFCKRRRYTFISGMGRTVFYDKRGEPVDERKLPKKILATLNEEITRVEVFGYRVADITEADIKE